MKKSTKILIKLLEKNLITEEEFTIIVNDINSTSVKTDFCGTGKDYPY